MSPLLTSSWGWLKTQGFNSTLTEPVDTSGNRSDQIREKNPNLHPELKEHLTALCNDKKTTIVVLSGSKSEVLDKVRLEFSFFLLYPQFVLYQNHLIALTELCGV